MTMFPQTRRLLANNLRTNTKRLTYIATELKENSDLFYSEIRIPKGRGRYRVVYKVAPGLAHLHSLLKRLLERLIPATGTSYAYETGIKLSDTATRMQAHKLLVSLDFKNHFTSVSMWQVTKMLEHHGAPKEIAFLIARLCCITRGKRSFLPQGSVVSPLLSNRVSEHLLDPKLAEEYPEAKITRYSDNLYIAFSSNEVSGVGVLAGVKKLVRDATGWKCHKCRIMPYYRQQRGLGLVLNERANMPKDKYLSMKAIVYNLANKEQSEQLTKAKDNGYPEVETVVELIDKLNHQLVYWKQFLTESKFTKLKSNLQLAEEKCNIEQQLG
jgi:RNA-directed DNA polymerase